MILTSIVAKPEAASDPDASDFCVDPDARTGHVISTDSDGNTEMNIDSDSDGNAGMDVDSDAGSNSNADSNTDMEIDSVADSDSNTDSNAGMNSDTDSIANDAPLFDTIYEDIPPLLDSPEGLPTMPSQKIPSYESKSSPWKPFAEGSRFNTNHSQGQPSGFVIALGLWVFTASVSRSNYAALCEVLASATSLEELRSIPRKLDTLKRYIQDLLPVLPTKVYTVPVDPKAQSSVSPATKNCSERETSMQYVYSLPHLFSSILSSDLGSSKLHFGMAEYSDHPVELWHHHAWGSSLVTTSGQYASCPDSGDIFLPSDFVQFVFRSWQRSSISSQYGRIIFVGKDTRSYSQTRGQVVCTVQPVLEPHQLAEVGNERGCSFRLTDPHIDSGYQLVEDAVLEVPLASISSRVSFQLVYADPPTAPSDDIIFIYHVLTLRTGRVRLCTLMHPLRAELELETFGRGYFVWLSHQPQVKSVPFLLFIDDFGAHRNMFRALKGIYLTPAGLSYQERRRLANSFTVTLGPHGASFQDVLANISTDLETVAKGFYSTLYGEQVIVTASVMALTGDMPQQAKNSGMLSYSANIGCRTCYCPRKKKIDPLYDIVSHGRYHFQHQHYRAEGNRQATVPEQQKFFNAKGIQSTPSPIEQIVPALDVVLGRPYDIPHSDWKGIGYRLLEYIQRILLPSGVASFSAALQRVVRPTHWPRFPSLKHLKTWTLSELGRGIIILPIILRCCATTTWFHARFLSRIQLLIPSLFPITDLSSPLQWLIRACAEIALTTTLISTSRVVPPDGVRTRVSHSRRVFQYLMATASGLTDSQLHAFRLHGIL